MTLRSQTGHLSLAYGVQPANIIADVFGASNLSPQAEATAGEVMARHARTVEKQRPKQPFYSSTAPAGETNVTPEGRALMPAMQKPVSLAALSKAFPSVPSTTISNHLQRLRRNGWATFDKHKNRWTLTDEGRAQL